MFTHCIEEHMSVSDVKRSVLIPFCAGVEEVGVLVIGCCGRSLFYVIIV